MAKTETLQNDASNGENAPLSTSSKGKEVNGVDADRGPTDSNGGDLSKLSQQQRRRRNKKKKKPNEKADEESSGKVAVRTDHDALELTTTETASTNGDDPAVDRDKMSPSKARKLRRKRRKKRPGNGGKPEASAAETVSKDVVTAGKTKREAVTSEKTKVVEKLKPAKGSGAAALEEPEPSTTIAEKEPNVEAQESAESAAAAEELVSKEAEALPEKSSNTPAVEHITEASAEMEASRNVSEEDAVRNIEQDFVKVARMEPSPIPANDESPRPVSVAITSSAKVAEVKRDAQSKASEPPQIQAKSTTSASRVTEAYVDNEDKSEKEDCGCESCAIM